jgi:DNA polymerase I-like protein with 3'-5' exonuclease and polymerase domains
VSVEDSIKEIESWKMIQLDSETTGRDAHLCDFLCVQFGNDKVDKRIVVDCTTVDIKKYKEVLESKLCILQNAKFDLQFFFNYGIIIRKVYDTMIAEQVLHLGWPAGQISYALNAIAERRLHINIDKTVRGEIIWRGLDNTVIQYAAGDVTYLEKIMWSQVADLKKQDLLKAAKIECDFVPAISYLEWCGIHLDREKWIAKMKSDQEKLNTAEKLLNDFVVGREDLKQYVYIDTQGDLWGGFDLTPKVNINWSSSQQVVKVAKILGFDTQVKDKKTGEDKDSVLEKHLKAQKGICDEFLDLYFDYQEHFKVVSSFGQGHLNAINTKTDRIHTVYRQLGAASGRMSCGSQQPNTDLAKYKKIPAKECTYPNMQQLPADEQTRGAFTAPKGYEWCSCDYSALESRLGADIYNEKAMIDEFLHGSGDMHSLCAYMVYKNIIPRDIQIKDIKKLFPKERKEVKGIEFSQQFGGTEYAIMGVLGCTIEEAREFKTSYETGFPGIAEFKKKGSEFVRKNGYILMCKYSGHKMYWYDHDEWLKRQESFTQEFWEEYKTKHKGTNDAISQMVSMHFKAASKYDRMALNAPTQGSGSVILKIAMTNFFNWIVDNDLFGKVEISALVHDEANIIYPTELHDVVPIKLKQCMEDAAALICTKLPIPAEAEIAPYWKH